MDGQTGETAVSRIRILTRGTGGERATRAEAWERALLSLLKTKHELATWQRWGARDAPDYRDAPNPRAAPRARIRPHRGRFFPPVPPTPYSYPSGGCRFIKSLSRVEYVPQASFARAAVVEDGIAVNSAIDTRTNNNRQYIIDIYNLTFHLLFSDISGVNIDIYEM